MRPLSHTELDCLRKIDRQGYSPTGLCSEHLLDGLYALGLVDRELVLWLPLEMKQSCYRLTPQGCRALADNNDEKSQHSS